MAGPIQSASLTSFLRGDPRRLRRGTDAPAAPRAATGPRALAPRRSKPGLPASEAVRLLDAPSSHTVQGLRDRAILALALHLGATRGEISELRVRDFQTRGGFESVRLPHARGTRRSPVHPEVAARVRDYLRAEGHEDQADGPLFRSVRRSSRARNGPTGLQPTMVDLIVRKYAERLGLGRHSTMSLRSSFLAGIAAVAGEPPRPSKTAV